MQPSNRQISQFYHELGRLVAGGIAIPQALDTLAHGRGSISLARIIAKEILRDGRIEEAFRRSGLDAADCAAIEAAADSGRIESVCEELSIYHTRLATVRSEMIKKSLYPIFMFLLTPLLLSLPAAIVSGDAGVYTHSVLKTYFFLAVIAVIFFGIWKIILMAYRKNPVLNRIIAYIPLVGGWLDFWAGSRFASVFSMSLRSGGDLLRGLLLAGEASRSATLERDTRRAVETIRNTGTTLTEALGENAPTEILRAIKIGEQTGRLDIETHRAAQELEERAFRRLSVLCEWLPRLLYLAMTLYVGYSIINMMSGINDNMKSLLE